MNTSNQTYKELSTPFFKETFDCILETNLHSASKSQIAKNWAQKLNSDIEYAHSILKAFQKGILKD